MTVTLTNTTRRMKVFVLGHETYCAARGTCACTLTPGRQGRRLAASLTIPAGQELSGLDPAVLLVPEVARAIRFGELRVRRESPAPSPWLRPAKDSPRPRRRKTR